MTFDGENNPKNMPSTSMRPPSRIPAASGLAEISNSDSNARSMIPPPTAHKHKGSALPEPPFKRKITTADNPIDAMRNTPSRQPKLLVKNNPKAVNGATSHSKRADDRIPSLTSYRQMSGGSSNGAINARPSSTISSYKPISVLDHARAVSNDKSKSARTKGDIGAHMDSDETSLNTRRKAWDTKGRLEDMESLYVELKQKMEGASSERSTLEESVAIHKARLDELNQINTNLANSNKTLSEELIDTKSQLRNSTLVYEDARRKYLIELEDLSRQHRNTMIDCHDDHRRELDRTQAEARDVQARLQKETEDGIRDLIQSHRQQLTELQDRYRAELQQQRQESRLEAEQLQAQLATERQNLDSNMEQRDQELQKAHADVQTLTARLEEIQSSNEELRRQLERAAASALSLDSSLKAYKAKVDFLESDNQAQSQAFADLNQKMQDAIDRATEAHEKLRAEETLRRRLHNQVQELKGNIRVFCRVRPTLEHETEDLARIAFPDSDCDCKEVAIQGHEQRSALGNVTTATNGFSFDRVFPPVSLNEHVFDEISQLVQSALDGYNVCIFCYGQTGSGKTHTMSAPDGMIPRAVQQMFDTVSSLRDKGWTYTMEGSFIEVYNEALNDLLGKAEDWEKKKHEIKHDPIRSRTTVTDVNTVMLDSPETVHKILEQANRNRIVATTKANARSSRSHSVFILRLTGDNAITGEHSEGTLNLVDLAGSERLSHSGATGDRMKETQHINKSLSSLQTVIGALGQSKDGSHIPYRDSKLTYLLQYSLGGNSKTLMFVMISPLQVHLNETLISLKFATKVHNTHIGTARRHTKIKG